MVLILSKSGAWTVDETSRLFYKPQVPLFSTEEKRKFVKSFITAYQSGSISIRFPRTSSEYDRRNLNPLDLTRLMISRERTELKSRLKKLIIMDSQKYSPNQVEKAFSNLYSLIIRFQMDNLIKGDFMKFSFDDRIKN